MADSVVVVVDHVSSNREPKTEKLLSALSHRSFLLFLMRKTNTQRLAEQELDYLRGGTNFEFSNKQQVVVEKMEEEEES